MRLFFRLATLLTLLAMVPGVRELVEQGGHLVVSGHSSHASEHPEGNMDSDEDGCGGAMHVCHCCRTPVITSAALSGSVSLGTAKISNDTWSLSSGVASQLLRPPLA